LEVVVEVVVAEIYSGVGLAAVVVVAAWNWGH
jgi:hypothetical protein